MAEVPLIKIQVDVVVRGQVGCARVIAGNLLTVGQPGRGRCPRSITLTTDNGPHLPSPRAHNLGARTNFRKHVNCQCCIPF